jgi:hypothetical protein
MTGTFYRMEPLRKKSKDSGPKVVEEEHNTIQTREVSFGGVCLSVMVVIYLNFMFSTATRFVGAVEAPYTSSSAFKKRPYPVAIMHSRERQNAKSPRKLR